MSAVLVLLMVVVLLAFALGVVLLLAFVLRKEADKVRAARGDVPSVETTGQPDPAPTADTEDTAPVDLPKP